MVELNCIGENEWCFSEPDYVGESIDEFYESLELMNQGELEAAEDILRAQIKECPDHIDAIHHLALIADLRGMELENLLLEKEAVSRALECKPKGFSLKKSKLEYICHENRPFLRAYHGLGLAYLVSGQTDLAYEIFSNLLKLNPNDNQGARALFIECCLKLNKPNQIVSICRKYPEDTMAETLYGLPLALIQLGKIKTAKNKLATALRYKPLVAESLLAKLQEVYDPGASYMLSGGKDEAFYYNLRNREYWESTKEAINILKMCKNQG